MLGEQRNQMSDKEMKDCEGQVLHYDSLLWTSTAIFIGAIGALFAFCSSEYNYNVAIFGLGLTLAALYLATSFRELRHKFQSKLDCPTNKDSDSEHRYKQWSVYVSIHLILIVLWLVLLFENSRAIWYAWVWIAVVALILTACIWYDGREPSPAK